MKKKSAKKSKPSTRAYIYHEGSRTFIAAAEVVLVYLTDEQAEELQGDADGLLDCLSEPAAVAYNGENINDALDLASNTPDTW